MSQENEKTTTVKPTIKILPKQDFAESLRSLILLYTAVLVGIENTLYDYGKERGIPVNNRLEIIQHVQKGGQSFLNEIRQATNVDELNQICQDHSKYLMNGGFNLFKKKEETLEQRNKNFINSIENMIDSDKELKKKFNKNRINNIKSPILSIIELRIDDLKKQSPPKKIENIDDVKILVLNYINAIKKNEIKKDDNFNIDTLKKTLETGLKTIKTIEDSVDTSKDKKDTDVSKEKNTGSFSSSFKNALSNMESNINKKLDKYPPTREKFKTILKKSVESYKGETDDKDIEDLKGVVNITIQKILDGPPENRTKQIDSYLIPELNRIKENILRKQELIKATAKTSFITKYRMNRRSKKENEEDLKKMINQITDALGNTERSKKFQELIKKHMNLYINDITKTEITKIYSLIEKYITQLQDPGEDPNKLYESISNELEQIQETALTGSIEKEQEKQKNIKELEERRGKTIPGSKQQTSQQASTKVQQPQTQQRQGQVPQRPPQSQSSASQMDIQLDELKKITQLDKKTLEAILTKLNQSRAIDLEGDASNEDRENDLTKSIIKNVMKITDFFVANALNMVTGGKINAENVNEASSLTKEQILILASYLNNISNDDEQLKAIQKVSEALGKMGIKIIDSSGKDIEQIGNKLIDLLEKTSSQAAEGAMKTFIGIAGSMLGQIPFLGGVINYLIAVGLGFNSAMRILKTVSGSGGDILFNGAKSYKQIKDRYTTGMEEIRAAFEPLMKKYSEHKGQMKDQLNNPEIIDKERSDTENGKREKDNSIDTDSLSSSPSQPQPPLPPNPNAAPPPPDQTGGKRYTNHHKILKTRKRIFDSISKFKNINSKHSSHNYTRKH